MADLTYELRSPDWHKTWKFTQKRSLFGVEVKLKKRGLFGIWHTVDQIIPLFAVGEEDLPVADLVEWACLELWSRENSRQKMRDYYKEKGL